MLGNQDDLAYVLANMQELVIKEAQDTQGGTSDGTAVDLPFS